MPVIRLKTLLQIKTSIGVLYSMSVAVQLYRLIQNSRLRPRRHQVSGAAAISRTYASLTH